ncbi:MAG: hypothetical protein FJX29_07265 [Alphaproteobacteria bacterium]|nr:hypothetical protein [Alphaproteobacteria bacterium]
MGASGGRPVPCCIVCCPERAGTGPEPARPDCSTRHCCANRCCRTGRRRSRQRAGGIDFSRRQTEHNARRAAGLGAPDPPGPDAGLHPGSTGAPGAQPCADAARACASDGG